MKVDEQLNVLNAVKEGKEVYYTKLYHNLIDNCNWTKVDSSHSFNFEEYYYSVGKPKPWLERLCDESEAGARNMMLCQILCEYGDLLYNTNYDYDYETEYDRDDDIVNMLSYVWDIAINYCKHTNNVVHELKPTPMHILKESIKDTTSAISRTRLRTITPRV